MMHHRPVTTMRDRFIRCASASAIALTATLILFSVGCSKEEPPPPPPPKPKKVEPVTPAWQPIADTMMLSSKVKLDSAFYDQCTEPQMRASFQFLDAFATGDDQKLRGMLHPEVTGVLDDMHESGEWEEATSSIRQIDLVSCQKDMVGKVMLSFAIHTMDSAEVQTQEWEGLSRGDAILFHPRVTFHFTPEQMENADGDVGLGPIENDDTSRGRGRDPRDTDNPKDPRKRVPKQAPDPGDPGGPG